MDADSATNTEGVANNNVTGENKLDNNSEDEVNINKSYSEDELSPDDDHDNNELSSSMQPRLLAHPDDTVAYITVTDPVQHTEGLKGKFTMYRVAYDPPPPIDPNNNRNSAGSVTHPSQPTTLFPYATSVNRRYSDFSWLFDHLHKERPGSIIPFLPEKQKVSRFSESFVEDRRFHLEIFLRRVVCNPELKDTECLLVFIGGGDDEFKKAKKDGSFGRSARSSSAFDAAEDDNYNDGIEMNGVHANEGDHSKLIDYGKEKISNKKAGLKKWLKEKKTTMQGTMIRSPDDAVFEEVTHYIMALEAGLKRVEAQASAMVNRDKNISSCLLEFGLGCDALGHIDDEMNGGSPSGSAAEGASGIAQAFRLVGKTADAISVLSHDHYERELSCFLEPVRDHLKMVHAVKVALSKRNNRRVTYSTYMNAVDSKKSSLHKYRITPGKSHHNYTNRYLGYPEH